MKHKYKIYIPELSTLCDTVRECSEVTGLSPKCIRAVSKFSGTVSGYTLLRLTIGGTYHHFKGTNYIVICIAKDTESDKLTHTVVYEKPNSNEIWIRPLSNFFEVLDRKKYPDASQTRRFEPYKVQ